MANISGLVKGNKRDQNIIPNKMDCKHRMIVNRIDHSWIKTNKY